MENWEPVKWKLNKMTFSVSGPNFRGTYIKLAPAFCPVGNGTSGKLDNCVETNPSVVNPIMWNRWAILSFQNCHVSQPSKQPHQGRFPSLIYRWKKWGSGDARSLFVLSKHEFAVWSFELKSNSIFTVIQKQAFGKINSFVFISFQREPLTHIPAGSLECSQKFQASALGEFEPVFCVSISSSRKVVWQKWSEHSIPHHPNCSIKAGTGIIGPGRTELSTLSGRHRCRCWGRKKRTFHAQRRLVCLPASINTSSASTQYDSCIGQKGTNSC